MNNLTILKTRDLQLIVGKKSNEVVLVDSEGDMFFTFLLKHIGNKEEGFTIVDVIDEHHANITIEIKADSIVKNMEPIEIGTYGEEQKKLFFGFVVNPPIAIGDESHNVNITFYLDNNGI